MTEMPPPLPRMLEASTAVARVFQSGGNKASHSEDGSDSENGTRHLSPDAGGLGRDANDWPFDLVIALYFTVAAFVLAVFLIRLYVEGRRRRW